MDFCIMDQNEENKKNDLEKDKNSMPYLRNVNLSDFEEYLKSNEYNDPILKNMVSINIHPSLNATPIFNNYNDDIKFR